MGLNALQGRLERLYDVSTPHRVEDFVLSDALAVERLTGRPAAAEPPEQLLLVQGEDAVEVGLFLEPRVLARVAGGDPAHVLRAGHLDDFCLALEGVSHFLYLAWNAAHERPVTLFELELQAEVDKFVTAAALLGEPARPAPLRRLRRALFERIRFRSGLSPEALDRYREANRLAARYCTALGDRFDLAAGGRALLAELRRFYRLPRRAKVEHIERPRRP